jgi:hypothetical protein
MAGIDLSGDGTIDMFPEEARTSVSAAGEADTKLNTNFDARIAEIASFDTQLGGGPLGRAVAGPYNDAIDAIVNRIKEIHAFATKIVDAGLKAVDDYVEGDVAAAQAFTLPEPLPPAAPVAPPTTEPPDQTGTTAPHATPTTGGR